MRRTLLPLLGAAAAVLPLSPARSPAQTDYYNLDAGRPLRTQDASAVEQGAFELHLAPLVLHGGYRGARLLALEPGVTWGLLPRTQAELGLSLARSLMGSPVTGLEGIHFGALHALNAETLGWPALALGLRGDVPAGPHANANAHGTLLVAVTRSLALGRVHLNAERRVGPSAAGPDDESRPGWRASLAADRAMAVRSLLLLGEVAVEEGRPDGGSRWNAAVGTRLQAGPRSTIDAGAGRRFGDDGEWFVTFGSSLSLGWPSRGGGR